MHLTTWNGLHQLWPCGKLNIHARHPTVLRSPATMTLTRLQAFGAAYELEA
jgi:hypothetical protein